MFKNKEGKVRSGWKVTGMLAAFYFSNLVLGIIIALLSCVYYIPKILSDGGINLQRLTDMMKSNSLIYTASMFGQELLTIILPVLAWKFLIKRPLSNMGLTSLKKDYKELFAGLLFGIVSMTAVFLLIIATGNAKVDSWTPHFTWDQLLYAVVFIFVGFAEEILVRGYIMSSLRQMRNVPAAVIISAVIFALLHSSNSGIGILPYINLALVGILFAYIYLKSGNLWMCIGFHITWNYFQGYVYGFKVSGLESNGILSTQYSSDNFLNGGAFGPEGGLFVTIVILFGFLFVKYYYRNSKFDFIASEDIGTPARTQAIQE